MPKLTSLPPMKALIAAESVIRNNSVAKAAGELNLTPSAISQQLRVLESAMKVSLFVRSNGKISVRADYRDYFKEITRSINIIRSAGESLLTSEDCLMLNVSVVPSFNSLCLLNAVSEFLTRHPQIKLNIVSSLAMANFNSDKVDISIRYTTSTSDNALVFEKIKDDYLIPCAHKALLEKVGSNDILDISKEFYLLEDISKPLWNAKPSWKNWYPSLSISENRMLGFTDYSDVYNAGIANMGAFIARTGLMKGSMMDENLTPLSDFYLKSGASFYVVYSSHIPLKPHVKAFKNWVLDKFSC